MLTTTQKFMYGGAVILALALLSSCFGSTPTIREDTRNEERNKQLEPSPDDWKTELWRGIKDRS